jgi:hypothetical protein
MRSILRRCGVVAAFGVVLLVLLVVADPASAGQDKDKGGHGPMAVSGSSEQPPGLVANVHAQANGHDKQSDEAPADLGAGSPDVLGPVSEPEASTHKAKPARAKGQAQGGSGGGNSRSKSNDAHHHVIVCHRTGSDSNPYVVINIPWTAWSEAHSAETGSHPTLNGRDDILLKDPASRPGSKDGFTKGNCRGGDPAPPPPPAPPLPPSPPSGGGAAGALGEEPGSAGRGALPFTGMPVLMVLLAVLGAAVGAAWVTCSASQQGQGLERRAGKTPNRADVRDVPAEKALDGTPDDPPAR